MRSRKARILLSLPRQLWASLMDRPLPPPTSSEQQRIDELRQALQSLSGDSNHKPYEGWDEAQGMLRDKVLSADPRQFTRWDVIRKTMFIHVGTSVVEEYKALRGSPDWSSRWQPAVQEVRSGRPRPFFLYTRSSGNLLHHAYHLLQIEHKTPYRIDRFASVFEFGGGYGSMCRLFQRLGFAGRYVIFDLPAFSHLQRFYLGLEQMPLLTNDAPFEANGIRLTTDRSVFAEEPLKRPSLFVACWSLSETPLPVRQPFSQFIGKFDCFMIGYNERYLGGGDDREYWKNFGDKLREQYNVQDYPIQHMPGNRYLIGWRR